MPRFLMSAGHQPLRPDFSCRFMNVCQPLVQSIAPFDVWTMGWVALHAEPCSRRVCARNTSITWQEPTRRAWLWAPVATSPRRAIQQIRSWCAITWLLLFLCSFKTSNSQPKKSSFSWCLNKTLRSLNRSVTRLFWYVFLMRKSFLFVGN